MSTDMSEDRKRFSRRREELLINAVLEAITELRIQILRGELNYTSEKSKDDWLVQSTEGLASTVSEIYRRRLS